MYTQGQITDDNPIVLSGDGSPRARFGTSVINIGDVNDDGFEGEHNINYICPFIFNPLFFFTIL